MSKGLRATHLHCISIPDQTCCVPVHGPVAVDKVTKQSNSCQSGCVQPSFTEFQYLTRHASCLCMFFLLSVSHGGCSLGSQGGNSTGRAAEQGEAVRGGHLLELRVSVT